MAQGALVGRRPFLNLASAPARPKKLRRFVSREPALASRPHSGGTTLTTAR